MKSWKKIGLAVIPAALCMSFPAFAGQWEQNSVTWKYAEDDGSYAADTWQWIDGNGDGIAECYHFDENGNLSQNTVVDSWIVNSAGAWVVGGNVQQMDLGATQEEIEAIYQAVSEVGTQMNSMDAQVDGVLTLTMDGESLRMLMDMDIKANGLISGNLEMLYDMSLTAEGETITMDMFYQDGYMYMDTMGTKIKMPMDMEEAMQQSMAISTQMNASDPLYGIENLRLYYDGERKTIAYDMNSAELNSAVQALMGASGINMAEMGTVYEVTRASGTVTINGDGYPVEESVSMEMTMDFLGITMDMGIDMDIQLKNPGQPVRISFPSTDGYEELVGYMDTAL